MAFIIDTAFDSGLSYLTTNGARMDICYGSEPTTYAEATSTKSCGNDVVTTGSPAAGTVDGRKVTVSAITAGNVTATQTAGWWALTDGSSILLATGVLDSTQSVTLGNTFSLDTTPIGFRDATSV